MATFPQAHQPILGSRWADKRIQRNADQIERKWKSVRRRNHAMNMVTNTMQNGILAVDSDLHIVLINPAAKQMLGIVGSAEGMSISEASHDVRLNPVFTEAMAQEGVTRATLWRVPLLGARAGR